MSPQRQRRKVAAQPGSTGSSRRQAAQRGYAFERWVADHNGGEVWPGQDGDVDAHGYRVECKYRSGLSSYGELHQHIEQAQRNSKASGKPWVLALTGGKDYQNYAVFALVPFEEWDRLSRLEDDKKALLPLMQPSGTYFRALVNAFYSLSFEMAEELRARDRDGDDNADPGGAA